MKTISNGSRALLAIDETSFAVNDYSLYFDSFVIILNLKFSLTACERNFTEARCSSTISGGPVAQMFYFGNYLINFVGPSVHPIVVAAAFDQSPPTCLARR